VAAHVLLCLLYIGGRTNETVIHTTSGRKNRATLRQGAVVSKKVTPDFLRKNRKPGAFYFVKVILICLQLFLPIFPNPVGDMAARKGERKVHICMEIVL
jgi:hypothetical protein